MTDGDPTYEMIQAQYVMSRAGAYNEQLQIQDANNKVVNLGAGTYTGDEITTIANAIKNQQTRVVQRAPQPLMSTESQQLARIKDMTGAGYGVEEAVAITEKPQVLEFVKVNWGMIVTIGLGLAVLIGLVMFFAR